jgi:hypothetical protein
MKRFFFLAGVLTVVAAMISAASASNPNTSNVRAFPGILANARYVYVAAYDGDQFNPNLLSEDRDAISVYRRPFTIGAN